MMSYGSGWRPRAGRAVLLVDDNEDDRELALMALQRVAPGSPVFEARNGVEALDWLRARGSRPAVVLLDLKMPRLDGAGVLAARLEEAALRGVPVVVFTTSRAEGDIRDCYALGANVYLVKPDDAGELERVLGNVLRVYLGDAELNAAG